MKTTKILTILVLSLGLMVCAAAISKAADMGTAFTYQSRLIDDSNEADGLYDFQFKLYDSAEDGNQINSDFNAPNIDVIDGYFIVELDFGSVFDGSACWLEIGVRDYDPFDVNVFTILEPRQKITPTPYAIYAGTAGSGGSSNGGGWVHDGDFVILEDNSDKVGIGVDDPCAKLEVDGKIYVGGDSSGYDVTFLGGNSNSKFFWNAEETALRAIYSGDESHFSHVNIGEYSFATGHDTMAKGISSFATGYNTTAKGDKSFAAGSGAQANGSCSISMGYNTTAYNQAAAAIGYGADANGNGAISMGYETTASHEAAAAIGFRAEASGCYSVAIGDNVTSHGDHSLAMGRYTEANANESFAIGVGNFGSELTNNTGKSLIVGFNNNEAALFVGGANNRVGIRTRTPGAELDVNGQIKITDGYEGDGKVLTSDENGLASWETPSLGDHTATQNIRLNNHWLSNDGGYEGIYVDVNGNVGIGTTDTNRKLNVNGHLKICDPYSLFFHGGGAHYITNYGGTLGSASDKIIFRFTSTEHRNVMTLTGGDRVGIRTTEPQRTLDLNGSLRIRDLTEGTGTTMKIQSNGDVVKESSSIRFKKDVRDLNVESKEVCELRPVRFNWKESGDEDIGLIAEEVDQVVNDLVIYDEQGRPDAVKYDKIALYLLAIVKEQQEEIAVLEERLEVLERASQPQQLLDVKEVQ